MNKTNISAIAAMADNRIIGKNNQLPWHLPADLKHFKALTTGHPILMGRKTFESIGRPLPNRVNIILTRNPNYTATGCIIVTSIEAALNAHNELFVIGGADVYRECLPHVQHLYLTIVHHHFDGDTYFPELNMHEWQESSRIRHEPDAENAYAYSFITLQRLIAER